MATQAYNRRPRHNTRGERMMDLMAEQLSETGDVKAAGQALGINHEYAKVLFKRVRRELGWQAR